MTVTDMHMSCVCRSPVTFRLHDATVDADGVEKMKVQVFHDYCMIYVANLGGRKFTIKAAPINVAYVFIRNIMRAAQDEKLDAACIAMWANASYVLSTLMKGEE